MMRNQPTTPSSFGSYAVSLILHALLFGLIALSILKPRIEPNSNPEPMLVMAPEDFTPPPPEVTPGATPKPTPEPTPEPTPRSTPEPDPTPAEKEITTEEKKPKPTPKPTPKPSPKPTAEPTPKPTAKPTATPKPQPTKTPKPEPTSTPKPEPTATPKPKPTATPKATPVSLSPEEMRKLYKENQINASGRTKPTPSSTQKSSQQTSRTGTPTAGKPKGAPNSTAPGGGGMSIGKPTAKQQGMSLSTNELPLYYQQGALQHVARFFSIPKDQQRSVEAIVEFRIQRNGTIADIRLKKSCGVSSLDERALDAMKRAKQFSPLPDSVRDDSIRHEITFSMTL